MNQSSFDSAMMDRTFALARKGEGRVEPNPMVGCVIVKKRGIIGQGYHRRFGQAHAEINALRACAVSPRGATVYVSLEPCGHTGKTPPCVAALIEARVREVVVAVADPNPRVGGGGIRALRRAGIRVRTGVQHDAARCLITPFLTRILYGRPYVIAKWAQSLDGKLATRCGDSQWISCAASRKQVHRLRARVDAVIVGSGTLLADDPLLTARNVAVKRVAVRVVFDARLRTPVRSQLASTATRMPTLVFTSKARASSRKADSLRRLGVEVRPIASRKGRLSLSAGLGCLHRRDLTNVLVEGGGTLLSTFLRRRFVDEARIYVAPIILGDAGAVSILPELKTRSIAAAIRTEFSSVSRSGDDICLRIPLNPLPE